MVWVTKVSLVKIHTVKSICFTSHSLKTLNLSFRIGPRGMNGMPGRSGCK